MVSFIDENKETYGVEPMCSVLPIAPSTYYEHARRRREPERRPQREKRDEKLQGEIGRLYEDTHLVCGAKKVWRQLEREGVVVARCTVKLARFETDGPRCRGRRSPIQDGRDGVRGVEALGPSKGR
jgi:hypothetical protein